MVTDRTNADRQPGEWLPVTNQAGRLVGWGRYWPGMGVEYRWGDEIEHVDLDGLTVRKDKPA